MPGVAVIGCGLIGSRRAAVVAEHPDCRLLVVADTDPAAARRLAQTYGCCSVGDWREAIHFEGVELIVASTPNGYLDAISRAGLAAGRHVLLEKPMGCNLAQAQAMAQAARDAGRVLKVGFNHRYHPALSQARALVRSGAIGNLTHLRARYGHGGRPGYENEWRGNPQLAGGGVLTDQGVHLLDLIHWFVGLPERAYCVTQTAVWPVAPLEDNAFAVLRGGSGALPWNAAFHVSWTQWKNLFCFEIFGTQGSLVAQGLGGSYGPELLTLAVRRPEGGVPELSEFAFEGADLSWKLEWEDFLGALQGRAYHGDPDDGLAVMRMLGALYASARHGEVQV